MDPHELTAAYALDALDSEEAAGYERHLGQCAECREQLAELNESATALAFGAVAPAPPERLRATQRRRSARTSSRFCAAAGSRAGSQSPRRWRPASWSGWRSP